MFFYYKSPWCNSWRGGNTLVAGRGSDRSKRDIERLVRFCVWHDSCCELLSTNKFDFGLKLWLAMRIIRIWEFVVNTNDFRYISLNIHVFCMFIYAVLLHVYLCCFIACLFMLFYCIFSTHRLIWTYSFIHKQTVNNSGIVAGLLMARVLHTKREKVGAIPLTFI